MTITLHKIVVLLRTMNVNNYKVLLQRLGLLMGLYTLCRVAFSVMNDGFFEGVSASHYGLALLHGIRFDIAAIFIINSVFVIVSVLPMAWIHRVATVKYWKVLFFVTNIPMLILNIADIEYFKFTGKRTQSSVLGIAEDVKAQAFQLIAYYWYFVVVVLVLVYFLWKFYPQGGDERQGTYLKPWYAWLILPFTIAILVFGIRGGVQLKPLSPNQAFVVTPHILGHFSLNSPYVFIASFAAPGRLEALHYFATDTEAKQWVVKPAATIYPQPTKDNVVILIVESFDREYLGIGNTYPGFTPFFDSLARKSLYFNHCFANGRTSIEALPSILASLPSLMQEPFITSYYQDNSVCGLGTVLKKEGYQTSFFHGGKNGTMNFNSFAGIAGFDQYYGLNEYPNQSDYDGNWGIFDEPYLQYAVTKFSEMKQPFATAVFTLSAHQPYTIPVQHQGKFPKGDLEIHECIAYSDYALKKFFEAASKTDWFKNTLFVITADHTQQTSKPAYQNIKGEFSVPLLFYHPQKNLKADTSIITQQTDIMPSVLALLGIANPQQLLFGKSVFDPHPVSEAVNFANGVTRVFHKNEFIEFNAVDESVLLHQFSDESVIDNPALAKPLVLKAKAYQQYFNNSLIKNQW